ncbi:MAG: hypothetical protein ACRD8O_21505 [Bryobacteraceae bacterium]
MSNGFSITGVVRASRRRFVVNAALAEAVTAACLAAGGVILILIAGTQLLDWRWLALVIGVSMAAGARRVAQRLPSLYRVAQAVDRRLALHDSLSTAFFFAENGEGKVSAEMRDAQRVGAERLARTIDVRAAVPMTAPRAVWMLTLLAGVASALFTARYLLEKRLDLQAPLTRVLFDGWVGAPTKAAQNKRPGAPKNWEPPPAAGAYDEQSVERADKLDPADPSALDTVDVPEVNNEASGVEKSGNTTSKGPGSEPGDEQAEGETGENGAEGTNQNGSSDNAPPSDEGGDKQGPGQSGESSSLSTKLRDAVSNLMSKLRPQNSSNANRQKNDAASSQQASANQKGSSQQNQKQSSGDQAGDPQQGEPGGDPQAGQEADGKGSGQSADQQASKSPGSGMGKQDGSKEARLAEQLDAMGKISEIIGKRSANVSGEVTVEVQTTKQQLRTPYSDSRAAHAQSGGAINRDEVPAGVQHYVQEYFERVRKQGGAAAPVAAPAKEGAARAPAASAPPSF